MEATIRTGGDIATLVNVFTVEPDNQQKLVQLLKDGTETFFSKQPGFISSSVHASKEGRRARSITRNGQAQGTSRIFATIRDLRPTSRALRRCRRPRRSCARSSRSITPER
ncbi:hypothetical protein ABIF63_009821 [Bradyrhizobium japonicum]|uniref:ABM domain-containing protein n=2 Tax=Bradyrhizobium japonicum TaxID=375 RepID=A0ABV2SA81_BRAJP